MSGARIPNHLKWINLWHGRDESTLSFVSRLSKAILSGEQEPPWIEEVPKCSREYPARIRDLLSIPANIQAKTDLARHIQDTVAARIREEKDSFRGWIFAEAAERGIRYRVDRERLARYLDAGLSMTVICERFDRADLAPDRAEPVTDRARPTSDGLPSKGRLYFFNHRFKEKKIALLAINSKYNSSKNY
jgi:hypothetical protein